MWILIYGECWAIFCIRGITGCRVSTGVCGGGMSGWEKSKLKEARVKNYVLDTNVLLHDPNSLLSFQKNNVLVPIEVIEEIDRFKREATELGQNARTVSRTLDGLRGKGSLSEGVELDNGGRLRIVFRKPGHHNGNGSRIFGDNTTDGRILLQALDVKKGSRRRRRSW